MAKMANIDNKFMINYIHKTIFSFWIPTDSEAKMCPYNLKTVFIYDSTEKNPEWKVLTYDVFQQICYYIKTFNIRKFECSFPNVKHLTNGHLLHKQKFFFKL